MPQQLSDEELAKKYGSQPAPAATGVILSEDELAKKYGSAAIDSEEAKKKSDATANKMQEKEKFNIFYSGPHAATPLETGLHALGQGAKGANELVEGLYGMGKDVLDPRVPLVQGPSSLMNKYIVDPFKTEQKKSQAALANTDRPAWKRQAESFGHGLASVTPLVGPWAAGVGEQAGTGDVFGAVARGGTAAVLGAKLPKLVEKGGKIRELVEKGGGKIRENIGAAIHEKPSQVYTRPTSTYGEFVPDYKVVRSPQEASDLVAPSLHNELPWNALSPPRVPSKPTFTPGAKTVIQTGGALAGGIAGLLAGHGMGEWGPMGGAFLGYHAAPSLAEMLFPEPKGTAEWRADLPITKEIFKDKAAKDAADAKEDAKRAR